jgi:neutral ceramidase
VTSTCNGTTQGCIGKGPGKDMFESTEIIARNQYDAAESLYSAATAKLVGPVQFAHTFVDMQNVQVSAEFSTTGQPAKTCKPAMGYAFAGGTTDGPGDFDFHQGTNSTNPFWAWLSSFLAKPTPDQIACQAPKPILLDVGLTKPFEWVPFVLPLQLVRIGSLYIVAVPGEFTTMSGRRLKQTVLDTLAKNGQLLPDTKIVIAGLANSYSHYIATYEEYQIQRYEGGSTLYGPHTLDAYRQEFSKLAQAMATGSPVPPGPTPTDMRNHTFSFLPGVITDMVPSGQTYGSLIADVKPTYRRGDLVTASFWGASPRNDLLLGKSFMYVQLVNQDGSLTSVASDASWETKYQWERVGLAYSKVTLSWDSTNAAPGHYRFQTFGVSKDILGFYTPYSGHTGTFVLT